MQAPATSRFGTNIPRPLPRKKNGAGAGSSGENDDDDDDDDDEEGYERPSYAGLVAVRGGGGPKQSNAARSVPRRGPKTVSDDAPWDAGVVAGAKLAEALDACYRVLQEKPSYPRAVAEGVHEPAEKCVRVTVSRGPLLQTMGFRRRSKLLLWPEEALFLLERGSLIVRKAEEFPGRRQPSTASDYSVQEGYARLLAEGQGDLVMYQVLAHLKRFGYRVRRFPSPPPLGVATAPSPWFLTRVIERLRAFAAYLKARVRQGILFPWRSMLINLGLPTGRAFKALQVVTKMPPQKILVRASLRNGHSAGRRPAADVLEVFKPSSGNPACTRPDYSMLFIGRDHPGHFMPHVLEQLDAFRARQVEAGFVGSVDRHPHPTRTKQFHASAVLVPIVAGGDVSFVKFVEVELGSALEGVSS